VLSALNLNPPAFSWWLFSSALKLEDMPNKKSLIDKALSDSLSRVLLVNIINFSMKKALLQAALENSPHYSVVLEWYSNAQQEAS